MNYKVGDKVRVREDLINQKYGNYSFIDDMNQYKGKEFVVKRVDTYACAYRLFDTNNWIFTDEMLEEPNTYGTETIADIIVEIKQKWSEINILLNRLESNLHE